MEGCIRNVCNKHDIKILVVNVMPEHVHLVVKTSININPDKILQLIKGGSSYLFFRHHPKAKLRYPRGHLWSKGKFMASVGFTDLEVHLIQIKIQEVYFSQSYTTKKE